MQEDRGSEPTASKSNFHQIRLVSFSSRISVTGALQQTPAQTKL